MKDFGFSPQNSVKLQIKTDMCFACRCFSWY